MKSMKISFAAYRYAPELFRDVRVYGRPFALDHDIRQRLGYIFITKGTVPCIAEIKRLYRAANKGRRRCTIGFMLKDSKKEFCYVRRLAAFEDDIAGKLKVYKEIKQDLLARKGIVEYGERAELGAGFQVENKEKIYYEADLSRPVKLCFR